MALGIRFHDQNHGLLFHCFPTPIKLVHGRYRQAIPVGYNHRNREKVLLLVDRKVQISLVSSVSLTSKNPVIDRPRVEYSITAQFTEGDPAYEWIILFLVSHHPRI